ncbi:hypothetical protein M9H77_16397 [Catharanthus roseus]|uniref:Uncharacterized protein n=1 Tax=Catharanthus roseus TaxID=4058 RepID=A0ACC0B1M9_CATRO|nr:hypothetical protein M9H77_16397 [Catharanthus roseus]
MAQLGLQKILCNLDTISSTPPYHHHSLINCSEQNESSEIPSSPSTNHSNVVSNYDSAQKDFTLLDLNLPPPPENPDFGNKNKHISMETDAALGNNLEEGEEKKSEIRFGALLDAVECAMKEYGNGLSKEQKIKEPAINGRKRRLMTEEEVGKVLAEAEEVSTSPVVKTKRGRVRVLPYKYRDSIIEPLTHLPSRHSRSSSNNGSNKRRPGPG